MTNKRVFSGLAGIALLAACGGVDDGSTEAPVDERVGEAELAALPSPLCGNVNTGYIPLNELNTGTYLGVQGGLYPGGSNVRPAAHEQAALATVVPKIVPRDLLGNPDPNGKIILASVGMSHTMLLFRGMADQAIARGDLAPGVTIVNGAHGQNSASSWADPASPVWDLFEQDLIAAGGAGPQLQAIWLMHFEHQFIPFPSSEEANAALYRDVILNLKAKYPSIQTVYVSAMPYGFYRSGGGISAPPGEPRFYEGGFAVKFLIEEQITGFEALSGLPTPLDWQSANPVAPWLSWSHYIWTDGLGPDGVVGGIGGRADGFEWTCPEDMTSDGSHPSARGSHKVSAKVLADFRTDPTIAPWFNGTPFVSVPNLVFIKSENGIPQLYTSDYAGAVIGTPAGLMGAGRAVLDFQWSPDRNWIAFRADRDTDDVNELYVVPSAGGTVVKVSGPMVAGGGVTSYAWSKNNTYIAYIADQATDDVFELYAANRSAIQSPTKLSGTMVSGGDVYDFTWSPSGALVAYRADSLKNDRIDVFKAIVQSASTARVNSAFSNTSGDVTTYAWSADSKNIAFLLDGTVDERFDLFVKGTGASVQLSQVPTNAAGSVSELMWSPDGLRVGYLIDDVVDEQYDLWTADPVSLARVKVSGNLTQAFSSVTDFAWAPNSTRVAYLADDAVDGQANLWSTLPAAQVPVKLSQPFNNPATRLTDWAWAPDSSRLAYSADALIIGERRLSTVLPASAQGRLTLSGNGDVKSFQFSPDSQRIAFLFDRGFLDDVVELYTAVPSVAQSLVQVSGYMVLNQYLLFVGDAQSFRWSSDSTRLTYLADQWSDELVELFTSMPTSMVGNVGASGPFTPGGHVLAADIR